MPSTSWHKLAAPREDLRRRQPLDAAQFAVHLDRVAAGDAPTEYVDPARFFARTYPTAGLRRFGAEVMRRLAGERAGSNAVVNLVTGFGGGKTHALTLLWHLAHLGPEADGLPGVPELLDAARLPTVPAATVAVFVGTDKDLFGGLGEPGEPRRYTPWGEIAWQLARSAGDPSLFEAVRAQDEARIRPGKEAIRRMLPADRAVLILMDEVMNFMTAARAMPVGGSTVASQFYEFVHALTEEADARDRLCVVVSLPKSEEEMSVEDESDFRRLTKITTRVAEPYVLARDLEIPEIVRRRLFDSVGDDREVTATSRSYARWLTDHRDLVPGWFPLDRAEETFRATYPFHPTVFSVFERKWQTLPSFQRTRGILRLLAEWVSIAYDQAWRGAGRDLLIGLGGAPLDDAWYRSAVLDQLGNERLTAAISADIVGETAHAQRLDHDPDATDAVRALGLHRRVASAIFFESSGGQVRDRATLPEIRLAVGEPDLEPGLIEPVLATLRETCYYLTADDVGYRFSEKANLNQLVADKRAALDPRDVDECAREEVQRVFADRKGVGRPIESVFFPEQSGAIADTAGLRLVVLSPEQAWDERTRELIERWMHEYGLSARRFPNALVWAVSAGSGGLLDAARRKLAWERLRDEAQGRGFDAEQQRQVQENLGRATNDLREAVWRAYRWLIFLGREGSLADEDLGILHSSAEASFQALVQSRLRQRDELTDVLTPTRLLQNWPPALAEWSTRRVRDALYASPVFTRLLDPDRVRDTIARGVSDGLFGYAAKGASGYLRVVLGQHLDPQDVEISDDIVLLPAPRAQDLLVGPPGAPVPWGDGAGGGPAAVGDAVGAGEEHFAVGPTAEGHEPTGEQPRLFEDERVPAFHWHGDVPPQKWTQFYTRVLSRIVGEGGMRITVDVDAQPAGGLSAARIDELDVALDELGLEKGRGA
ncbi:MAG: ATP-binding protein [Candidatus Limnocylindrales bacterium]